MNILYGVCGEGMGHAMRSAVVAEHLEAKGHHLRFVSSGSAANYLEKRWPTRVTRVVGLTSVMDRHKLDPVLTLLGNVVKQTAAFPAMHLLSLLQVGKEPDVVISDFEPWSARYAGIAKIPLVAVDNIHFMSRCTHPRDVVAGDRAAAALMFPAANAMVPDAKRYLVTTFVSARVSKPATTLHAPILRHYILLASEGPVWPHVTVYFNSLCDHQAILGALQAVPEQEFHFFGPSTIGRYGNVDVQTFDEERFTASLSSSKAVIGGAGFTLMSEAIFLKKPMLAVPFSNQFEQILNANYLQRMGFGERGTPDLRGIGKFLLASDQYREKLSSYRHDGNAELLAAVDEAIR